MKINKARCSKLTATAAIACMLAITCGANAAPIKLQPCAGDSKPTLQDPSNDNHNPLVPESFYNSNHETEG